MTDLTCRGFSLPASPRHSLEECSNWSGSTSVLGRGRRKEGGRKGGGGGGDREGV